MGRRKHPSYPCGVRSGSTMISGGCARATAPTSDQRRYSSNSSLIVLLSLALATAPLRAALAQDAPAEPIPEFKADKIVSLPEADDLLLEGKYAEAQAAFETLIQAGKQSERASLGLARVRVRIGEYAEAIADMEKLDAARNADGQVLLAQALLIKGEYDRAMEHLKQAIEIKPQSAAARRILGATLELLGRRDEAIATYRWFDEQLTRQDGFPRDAAWITDAAVGFLRYSMLTQTSVADRTRHVLTEMLQQAYERVDRSYWPARIAAADLLRARYNNDEADGSVSDYQAALRLNPKLPEAFVGLGEVLLEKWNFEEVEKHAEKALAVNPRFAPAFHLLARKFITERRYAQSLEASEKALKINERDVIALSLSAAASACRYDAEGTQRFLSRVEAINPRSDTLYHILGNALSGIRQYADSEAALLRAIEFEPTDPNSRNALGLMYMQWGLDDKARDTLDAAWTLDPFNKRTKFTLDLLESLDKFARFETEHFTIRHDPVKDPGLGRYMGEFLEEIHAAVIADYNLVLPQKTKIEVYPTQRAFAVRITGEPWIHTVGACTGFVIALASPRKAPDLSGRYNFARVLKHEYTHTVTLAATQNRIPHWFTEGLAVLQEDTPRSFGWSELLADAIRRGELFTLESIDWGFMRPRRPMDRQMAYAQSEWMCEYIVQRFGYDKLIAMLDRYRAGKTQAAVFEQLLGIPTVEFDRDFSTWARKEAQSWCFDLSPLDDVAALRKSADGEDTSAEWLGRLAKAELEADEFENALLAARKAQEKDENEPRSLEVVAFVLAMTAQQAVSADDRKKYEDEAMQRLDRLVRIAPTNWRAHKHRAEILIRREEIDAALESLEAVQRFCPLEPVSWRGIAGLHLQRKDYDRALTQLLELARSEDQDPEVAAQIAEIYMRQDRPADAAHWYREALCIDPFDINLHRKLAEAAETLGDAKVALREYAMLTALVPEQARYFERAAFAAKELGREDEVKHFAAQAVKLDAESAAKALLP